MRAETIGCIDVVTNICYTFCNCFNIYVLKSIIDITNLLTSYGIRLIFSLLGMKVFSL